MPKILLIRKNKPPIFISNPSIILNSHDYTLEFKGGMWIATERDGREKK